MPKSSRPGKDVWSPPRLVVPGLAVFSVRPLGSPIPTRIAVMGDNAGINLSLASVPGFLRACLGMQRTLKYPAQLETELRFKCFCEDQPDGQIRFVIDLVYSPETEVISVWAGGAVMFTLEPWELPALTGSVSALTDEMVDLTRDDHRRGIDFAVDAWPGRSWQLE